MTWYAEKLNGLSVSKKEKIHVVKGMTTDHKFLEMLIG